MSAPMFRRLLQRAGLLLALCLAVSTPALAAHPALWTARDTDTTVYLFGTVHLMPDDADWHFPALDRALDDSKVLYVEVANTNKALMTALTLQYGIDFDHPLSDKLDPAENALLKQAAQQTALPGGLATLQRMKPWLAALTISVAPLLKAGLDPEHGVDKLLEARMEKAGKPVEGLETAKQQILFLADLPEPVQLDYLRSTLHDYSHALTQLRNIIEAWKQGDVAALAKNSIDKMADKSPTLYRRLLVTRNRTWAHKIAAMMGATTGTIFIAVGAGHLAGPDSVQVQLRKLGIATTRVHDASPARNIPNKASPSHTTP